MKLTKWRDFAPASTYRRSLDRFFDDRYRSLLEARSDFIPAVNASEAKDSYTVEVAAPGLRKDDFNITVDDGVLTISGESSAENEREDTDYISREFRYTSFSRSFSLPKDVDDEHISAKYVDGILRIRLPRETPAEENEASRTVPVR